MWENNAAATDPNKKNFVGPRYIPQSSTTDNHYYNSEYANDSQFQSFNDQNSYSSNQKGPPITNTYYTPLPVNLNNYQPMADAAMTYGTVLAGQGKQIVEQKFEKWMSISRLKYYFAVDTKYVGKKLMIVLFPFLHKDWALQYDQENQPIAPRYDVNAPDLYIPAMAFVTFILISGWIMGLQKKFSPEQLGIQASTCLMWEIIEVMVTTLLLYIMNIGSLLRILDILAFSAYKYVGIILCVIVGTFVGINAYYIALSYFGFSIGYFMIKTLRLIILPDAYGSNIVNRFQTKTGNSFDPYGYDQTAHNKSVSQKQKTITYLLLSLCFFVQPIIMCILTYRLMPSDVALKAGTLSGTKSHFNKLKHKLI